MTAFPPSETFVATDDRCSATGRSRPIADIRRQRLNVGDRRKAAIADRDAGRHSWGKVLKSLGNVAELRGIHSSGPRLALAPSAR